MIKISNKYGYVTIDPKTNKGVMGMGMVSYEHFLETIKDPDAGNTIYRHTEDPFDPFAQSKELSTKEANYYYEILKGEWFMSMTEINPYMRQYIPEIDGPPSIDDFGKKEMR